MSKSNMWQLFTRKSAGTLALIAPFLVANANATTIPPINSLIPALIIESCLDKTDASLDSPEFIDCLTNTLTQQHEGENVHRSDPNTSAINGKPHCQHTRSPGRNQRRRLCL